MAVATSTGAGGIPDDKEAGDISRDGISQGIVGVTAESSSVFSAPVYSAGEYDGR